LGKEKREKKKEFIHQFEKQNRGRRTKNRKKVAKNGREYLDTDRLH